MKNSKNKKHILITGGAGYIGSACTKALLNLGYKITVIDNLSHGDKKYVDERANFIEIDLCNPSDLARALRAFKIDSVIHLAALKSVEESEKYPEKYLHNNLIGTINLLTTMQECEIPEIIFSSSAAVYAPTDNDTCKEDDELGAINVYGSCKIKEEKIITELARTGKIKKFSILRYFNVAGDAGLNYIDKDPANVFSILANSLKSSGKFNIFGTDYNTRDGTCVRDYIHLDDLVDAHIKTLEYKDSGIWNLGTSSGISVKELITEFEKVSGLKLNSVPSPRRAGDPATLIADYSLATTTLGWKPKCALKEMVESTINTYAK